MTEAGCSTIQHYPALLLRILTVMSWKQPLLRDRHCATSMAFSSLFDSASACDSFSLASYGFPASKTRTETVPIAVRYIVLTGTDVLRIFVDSQSPI